MTMAFTTLKDFIRNWQLFLIGLLLSVSPLLEMTASQSTVSTTAAATSSGALPTSQAVTTVDSTTVQTTAATTQTMTQAPAATTATTAAPVSMTTTTMAATATGASSTSQSMSTSAGAVSTSNPATASSSATPTSGMTSSQSTSTMGNTTSWSNGTTTWSNSSMSTISCRSFMCNYSDCYSMYTSQNASMCTSGYNYCELVRQTDICYVVSCSASCSMSCRNSSLTNCSVNCCNSTGCLNDTFASMMTTTTTTTTTMMTTSSRATTPSRPATTVTTAATTQGGKKCKSGKCNGTDCYTTFNTHETCSSSQLHCQLKKEKVGTNVQWTAGCTTNCSGQPSCKSSTQPPCHLECCNATMAASCLFLNGTQNLQSFATRGPHPLSELLISAMAAFVITLML